MLNWWLVLLIVIIPIICIGLTVWTIFYFQSVEDRGTALAPKIVFGLGLILALGSVLLVPFDIANSPDPTKVQKYSQSLNCELMWEIVLWMMAVMAIVICPFFMFFYEAHDPDKPRVGKQVAHGIIMTVVIFAIFALITGLCYAFVGVALLPFVSYATDPQYALANSTDDGFFINTTSTNETLTIDVAFMTYVMGMMTFFGWVFFFFYGGAGLLAYPIKSITQFTKRTKAISGSRFAQEMAIVLAKADALLELCLQLQKESRGTINRSNKSKINILRNEVYFLEAHEDQLIWAYTKAGGSPFLVYGGLLIDIVCLLTGLVWILHIFIYNIFDASPFLNTMLIRMGDTFALFGIIGYAVLTFYLQWATFQGQIMLGLRLIFFQIHPMKYHDTLINSFLFNASLLLITTFAVIQFAARSFQDYAPYTAISGLMNTFVLRLKGIGYFIKWAQVIMIGFALFALIITVICFKKKKRDPTKIRLDDIR